MKPINELLGGVIGTSTSAIGTAIQTNEVLQTISLIITILGGIMTLIVLPLLNWYRKAKQDGKITPDEIEEGVETLSDGIEQLNENIKKGNKENENKK